MRNRKSMMIEKMHWIKSGQFRKRDTPALAKPKTPYLAQIKIRADAIEGGQIPDDEVQLDFIISSAKRDGHNSYMTEKTLQNYAADAARGVPFMLDHSLSMEKQIGRTIAGNYDAAEKHTTATVCMLRDTDATPEALRVNEYIRRIERKFYDSCSVGYRDGTETCRIDNKPIWDWERNDPCPHVPGRSYDGKLCEYDIDDAFLREVSLVPSGSNTDAKQLDRATWEAGLQNIKKERGDSLAARLNELIGDDDRSSKIDRMAGAAGIDSSTVNQILNGSINCPPMNRLEGFARSLNVSVDTLTDAASADGCSYEPDDEARSLLARDGLKWRETLIVEAVKQGVRAEDSFDENKWRTRFSTQDSDFIKEQTQTWIKLGDAKWGKGGRKTNNGLGGRNAEPTLWLPESLFRV